MVNRWMLGTALGAFLCMDAPVFAQAQSPAPATDIGVGDIVVTAQKRSETANKVGMSITALASDTLRKQQVFNPADLAKIVPGFVALDAPRGTPVYSIRGIGFDDSSLSASPTVSLYLDEVPLSFPVEARFATLDLERVEVLKGPQGILFGQNSTAGAINFIAAKPTDSFHAGFDGSYGRFDSLVASGYLSGSITDTLKVRVSGMGVHTGAWQQSYTRDDTIGAKRQYGGRIIAEWQPIHALRITANVNGWVDKSDTQAAQLLEVTPNIPGAANPLLEVYPRSPMTPRAADWNANPKVPLRRNDSFLQASFRTDYSLSDKLELTTLTSWSRYKQDFGQDLGGVNLEIFNLHNYGTIHSFNQEARIAGNFDRLKVIVGGNYGRDKVSDNTMYYYKDNSSHFGFLGITDALAFSDTSIRNYAVFGNADYTINDRLTVHGGLRYTRDKRSYVGCTADPNTDGTFRFAFNTILGLFGTPEQIGPGGCTTSAVRASDGRRVPVLGVRSLDQDNVSWRAGIDYQVNPRTLLYANVSRGYKSGSFPAVNTADAFQLNSVTQESVLAYETGFKAGLFDHKLQLNGAAFYYDYQDKQLRGRVLDLSGFFGVLEALVNVPKSRVYGAELSAQIAPARGLSINTSATYVNSKVTGDYFNYDPAGTVINYKGLSFPHTPKWYLYASADYEQPLSDLVKGFVGANVDYKSATSGLFVNKSILAQSQVSPVLRPGVRYDPNTFDVKAYATVDLRIGIADPKEKWRFWLWGKNVFNKYYWTNVTQSFDVVYRMAGMPATYGLAVSFKY